MDHFRKLRIGIPLVLTLLSSCGQPQSGLDRAAEGASLNNESEITAVREAWLKTWLELEKVDSIYDQLSIMGEAAVRGGQNSIEARLNQYKGIEIEMVCTNQKCWRMR